MASMLHLTDDFSAKDAQVHFKLAACINKRCSNLNPLISENCPYVSREQFLLATLTYTCDSLWHCAFLVNALCN